MADVFSKAKRSEVMSRIRSRGNKNTELALVKLMRRHGITRWRRHMQVRIAERGTRSKAVFAVRPDFVFRQSRTVIFVDGCFWHGCPKHCSPMKWLRKSSMPANNPPLPQGGLRRTGRAFWRRKLQANKRRDRVVTLRLRRAGWRVLRAWEHELARKFQARLVRRIQRALHWMERHQKNA